MTNGPYLTLSDAGLYVRPGRSRGAAARWARRHLLGHVPHYEIPNSGIVFRREEIDAYLTKFRRNPQEAVDHAVRKATTFIQEVEDR
jgi:hypothetical protein